MTSHTYGTNLPFHGQREHDLGHVIIIPVHSYTHVLDFLYIRYPGAALRHAAHTLPWAPEHVSYQILQNFETMSTPYTNHEQHRSSEYLALVGSFILVGLEAFVRVFTLLLRKRQCPFQGIF